MDISPKLQLNLHPKDAENMSLVTANNIKLSNDGSCITNEESIKKNTFIDKWLKNYYGSNNYNIISVIPCNTELVLITAKIENRTYANTAQIFIYVEKNNTRNETLRPAYEKLEYHGGKINGTFTYNAENSLILAIAEYGNNIKVPLKVINLGNIDDNMIYNDLNLPDKMLSIAPEVYIPSVENLKYIKGNAYKGWYYLFVRFKINSVDYTQWYNFGFPVYVDSLEKYAITKYCYEQKITGMTGDESYNIVAPTDGLDGFCVGASDYFSNTSNIASETFSIDINFDVKNKDYKYYQIGIICASKKYTKAFRTHDIKFNWTDGAIYTDEFILNNKFLIDASAKEFIIDNYNYYNVKNIINYKNRLYISNYKENNANNYGIANTVINDIKLNLEKSNIYGSYISYDYAISHNNKVINYNNQYEAQEDGIPGTKYFNLDGDTELCFDGNYDIYTDAGKTSSNGLKYFKVKDISIMESNSEFIISNNRFQRTYSIPSFIAFVIKTYVNTKLTIYKYSGRVKIYQTTSGYFDLDKPQTDISCNNFAVNGGSNYINVNSTFNDRKTKSTLIPGEIYNFFIHFVDKYGHCTNGYKINNNIVWKAEGIDKEIIPIAFHVLNKNYYAAMPVEEFVLAGYEINTLGIEIYENIGNNNLTTKVTNTNLINEFKNFFSSFIDDKYKDLRWFQIASGYNADNFLPYYNNNGDKLFKVPINKESYNVINRYLFNVEGVNIPLGYVGWFISYEKFEPTKRVTGMLTRNDFRTQDGIVKNNIWYPLGTANSQKSDKMYFFSGQYDIADKINLDYNLMRIDSVNCWDLKDIPDWDYNQRSSAYKFCHDMNKPQVGSNYNKAPNCYAMPEYKLVVADSAVDNRIGLGTGLQIKDSYDLFPNYEPYKEDYNKIMTYRVTLFNVNRNIYMSDNKTLIRCTNIIYDKTLNINKDIYLNGVVTYDGCIIYENAGLFFNTANNIAYRATINTKFYPTEADTQHTYQINTPFMAYLQFPCIDDHFYESKCFNSSPDGYAFYVKQDKADLEKGNENNKFAMGCIVTPANSIDLFSNPQDSAENFNIKTYSNYKKYAIDINTFNKTIRRSAVIQDETRINNWRTFPVEAYKNITENKGIITNLIGAGTVLLVHTEHSLFMFDTDNTLKTEDKNIQLMQPDVFEVQYKEIFTSELGFGGLQDSKSFIMDSFGYIYYDNDSRSFYNFDNGQLSRIDEDISQLVNKYNFYNVRFGNDKFNNRILIKMDYIINNTIKNIVISYNYNTKSFISLHDYYFEEAYNTKNNLYLKCNNSHVNCSLHQFIQDESSYGSFDNIKTNPGVTINRPSKIGIVVNVQYDVIKFLDYISYKLNKIKNPIGIDYINSPIEGRITPYSGDLLKVYNDLVNTYDLDILIDNEAEKNLFCNYTKPYWELGMWNYSYLRNNIANRLKYGDDFTMTRIFGNYFIIEFTFNNNDGLKVEFEELKLGITK